MGPAPLSTTFQDFPLPLRASPRSKESLYCSVEETAIQLYLIPPSNSIVTSWSLTLPLKPRSVLPGAQLPSRLYLFPVCLSVPLSLGAFSPRSTRTNAEQIVPGYGLGAGTLAVFKVPPQFLACMSTFWPFWPQFLQLNWSCPRNPSCLMPFSFDSAVSHHNLQDPGAISLT